MTVPSSTLFPTTVVGSMPRPTFVRELLEPGAREELEEEAWDARMDAAVAYMLAMMESTGVDIITDGEWRRRGYTDVMAQMVDGFTAGGPPAAGAEPRPRYHTVVEPMHNHRHLIAEEAKFMKERTDRKIKVCLPSPFILGQRMWDPEMSARAYPTRRSFVEATIPFLRAELEAVRDVGVDVAQIDEPHISGFLDPNARRLFDDPETDIDFLVDCLNQVVQGVDGVRIALHVCRFNRAREGWRNEGGYQPVLPALKAIDVHEYTLEYSIPVAGDYAVLAELPEDRRIALGCVDCRSAHIDTPDEIAGRVERAMSYVDKERLLLTPDCGFAPGMGSPIPLDEPYLKLKNEVKAAEMLRERYG